MIDVLALRKHFEENPTEFFTVAALAAAIDGDESSVRNELTNLWVQHMKSGDWSHIEDHTEPMVVESPEHPPVWHLASSMTAADWSRVQAACISRALGGELRSERLYWLGRAMESLQAMTKLEG